MLIQEEYARRHGMKFPIVNYTLTEGTALLKATEFNRAFGPTRHVLMTVRWVPHDRHPGVFMVSLEKPNHDSHARGSFFSHVSQPATYQYEELEPALKGLVRKVLSNHRAIKDPIASTLFLWESFVCCFDGWFIRNGTTRLLGYTEASMDPVFSEHQRYEQYESAVLTLAADHPPAYDVWKAQFQGRRGKMFPWLADLINGD